MSLKKALTTVNFTSIHVHLSLNETGLDILAGGSAKCWFFRVQKAFKLTILISLWFLKTKKNR